MGHMTYQGPERSDRYISYNRKPRDGANQTPKELFLMDIFKNIAPYLQARFGNTEIGRAHV